MPKVTKKKKQKRTTLTLRDKLDLIKKMERGISKHVLMKEYNIGATTLYDIKHSKQKLLDFIASSGNNNKITNRKSLHKPRCENLDKILYEWVLLKQSEGVTITGPMILAKAKDFKEEMDLDTLIVLSDGWLSRFKIRHGIHFNERQKTKEILQTGQRKLIEHPLHSLKNEEMDNLIAVENNNDLTETVSDEESIDSVVNPEHRDAAICSDEDDDGNETIEKVSRSKAKSCMDTILSYFEQNPSFSMQQVMQAHMLKDTMITARQMSVKESGRKFLNKSIEESSSTDQKLV